MMGNGLHNFFVCTPTLPLKPFYERKKVDISYTPSVTEVVERRNGTLNTFLSCNLKDGSSGLTVE